MYEKVDESATKFNRHTTLPNIHRGNGKFFYSANITHGTIYFNYGAATGMLTPNAEALHTTFTEVTSAKEEMTTTLLLTNSAERSLICGVQLGDAAKMYITFRWIEVTLAESVPSPPD